MTLRSALLRILKIQLDPGGSLVKIICVKILLELGVRSNSKIYVSIRKLFHIFSKPPVITKTFSSFGEDRVLEKYLPESDGRYLDVGAGDPKYGSNTYFLYQRGWSGISIDPLKKNLRRHKYKRRRDQQILACVVSNDSQVATKFYEYIADEFSTDSLAQVIRLAQSGIEYKDSYEVPSLRLKQLELKVNPSEPFLFDLDIEGNELGVLLSNDWDSFLPRVISVEEWASPINQKSVIRELLESHGYFLVSRCFITSIYVHGKYLREVASQDSARSSWFTS
jgi:FkbM family methyltransferase